jgi:hypothetical protein
MMLHVAFKYWRNVFADKAEIIMTMWEMIPHNDTHMDSASAG